MLLNDLFSIEGKVATFPSIENKSFNNIINPK